MCWSVEVRGLLRLLLRLHLFFSSHNLCNPVGITVPTLGSVHLCSAGKTSIYSVDRGSVARASLLLASGEVLEWL